MWNVLQLVWHAIAAGMSKMRRTTNGGGQQHTPTASELSTRSGPAPIMVGHNFRVGKKIGSGNFGELRIGEFYILFLVNFHRKIDRFQITINVETRNYEMSIGSQKKLLILDKTLLMNVTTLYLSYTYFSIFFNTRIDIFFYNTRTKLNKLKQ